MTKRVVVSIVTDMMFNTKEDFFAYLSSKECKLITSFPTELYNAWSSKQKIAIATPRLMHGAVTCSTLEVKEVEGKNSGIAIDEHL